MHTYTHKEPVKPVVIKLRCRMCGEDKIPWVEGRVGCPPEYCRDCRKDGFGIYQRERKSPFR